MSPVATARKGEDHPLPGPITRVLVVGVLSLMVAGVGAWSIQRMSRGLLEDRALLQALGVARGAARLAESSRGTRSPAIVAYGVALAEAHPELHRLVVVDAGRPDAFGVRRKASTIYALDGGAASGGEPGAIADMDRPVLDRTNHLQARFASDAERARPLRLAELTEVSDVEAGVLRLAAYAPVRAQDGQSLIGLAAALLRVPAPTAPLPLWPFLAALLVTAVFAFLDHHLSVRPRGTLNSLLGALVPLAIAVPFLSATTVRVAVQAQIEARGQDLLAVQKAADAGGEWALVSPIPGREVWSPDGALRLTRDHLGLGPDALPGNVAALADVRATVELHPQVADALVAPYDWDALPWSFGLSLLFAALVLPILRLLYNVRRDPGVYAYVTPAVVGLVVLVVAPFTMGIGLAFYHYHLEGNAYEFIGFGNFVEIVAPSDTADIHFWRTLGVTVFWTVANVFLHVAIGLGLALLLNRPGLAGRRIYRVLLVLPWAVPSYITALLWRSLFLGEDGPINSLLGTIGIPPVGWLGDHFWTNFIPNLVTNTWLGFPFMMVVSLGALQSIPGDLYEAASLDGASAWQRFRSITLPLLKPALLPAIILGTIWTFNLFNVIYLVSMGAGNTEILITEAYRTFHEQHRHGYAAAYSVLIFFILLAYTWVTTRVTKASEGAIS